MKMLKLFFAVGVLTLFMGSTFAQTETIDHPNDAWVLLTHNDQRPNTRVALISGWRGESEIELEVVYDEGSGFDINKGITVTNGKITTPTKYVGGIAKLGKPQTHTVKIKRSDMNKPVTIQWFGGKAVTIPGTGPGVSRWQKLPNTPGNFEKIVAGANRFIAIDHDRQVFEWNYKTDNWLHISDHDKHYILADDAAIDMFNAIWVVHQDENKIFRYRARMTSSSDRSLSAASHSTGAGRWDEFPHPGKGITVKGVVAGGTRVFILDTDGKLHEYNFIEKKWEAPFNIDGNAVISAAVDQFNSLWAVGGVNNNRIYRKKYNGKWKKMDGYAREIFAASRRVFITGTDGQQYEWNSKTDNGWIRAGVYPKSTAVGLSAVIYFIENKGRDTGAVKALYYGKKF